MQGQMIHNTVNYFVPHEAHFQIVLVPFFPRFTEKIKPRLKDSQLWRGLNFITTKSLRRYCDKVGLDIEFEKGILKNTFYRLERDPEFARRQGIFLPVFRFLKAVRLINLLDLLPVAITTPIRFKLTKK